MLAAPSTIATAMDTSARPRSTSGASRPAPAPAQRRGQPGLVGQLAQQDRPGVADQALAVPSHFQRVVPARILHHEERSCPGIRMVWLPRNPQNRGALRYLDPSC